MVAIRLSDIEVNDVRTLQWEGHIIVCGPIDGNIENFIGPLREVTALLF